MDEKNREDHEPQVSPDEALIADLVGNDIAGLSDHAAWSDARFLRWLAERESGPPETDLPAVGRRMMVRAYCRRFQIRLFAGAPRVFRANSLQVESNRLVPLVDISALKSEALASHDQVLIAPFEWPTSRCVACRVSTPIDGFAPSFIEVGDTIMVALAAPEWSPALTLHHADGRTRFAEHVAGGESSGAIVALWSIAMV